MIVFLTGACGAGKTTLTNELRSQLPADKFSFYHSDDTPVPTTEEVNRLFRDCWDGWSRANTRKWVDALMPKQFDQHIIWDGQVNLDVLYEYLAEYKPKDVKIVLVECDPKEMFRRLIEERKQPELARENQISWRAYLHRQAEERGAIILDSTALKPAELAQQLMEQVGFPV